MKQAIWKVAPFGDCVFRGSRADQLVMDAATADFSTLRKQLRDRFLGTGWVLVESVKQFVASDETDFHTGHLRAQALAPMEATGEIEVDESTRKRRGTYPDEARLRFK